MSVGSCGRVSGVIEDLPQACACSVRRIPENCISCGGGNSVGSSCNFRVAGALNARGVCLPTSYLGNSNACFAIPFEGETSAVQCGGPVHATCPRGACCADDPRDGCVPSATNGNCVGICVDAQDCDPSRRSCGICGAFQAPDGGSQSEIARSVNDPDVSVCGDGVVGAGEACDGAELGGATCVSLGYAGGTLACAPDCRSLETARCSAD